MHIMIVSFVSAFIFVLNRNPACTCKCVKKVCKNTYILFRLLIGIWFRYSYMYVRKACNPNATSTYPPWNAHLMVIELFKLFECANLGRNRFGQSCKLLIGKSDHIQGHIV